MRDRLIEIISEYMNLEAMFSGATEKFADYLLANGVIVTPCVAMVEQFIKDGKFDKKHTTYNGRYAVVYVDKSKWSCPLIDITEQQYNAEKANERIEALAKRSENGKS